MGESKGTKKSLNEIFDVLEQQNKLDEVKALLVNVIEKVNQTVNSVTVENLQLTRSELDMELVEEEEPIKQECVVPTFDVKESHLINSQLLDIDIKPACFDEEIETDEELDQL